MNKLDGMDDAELLERVRSGDNQAYGVLYARHEAMAHRIARRLTPDRDLVDDAVNEAFTAVLTAIRAGSGPFGTFVPYLVSSVSRAVYRMNRKSMREPPVPENVMVDAAVTWHPELDSFDGSAAKEAFKRLPPRWRQVIWYLDIEDMPPRDAAPLMDLTPNATVALHRRAKEGLRLGYLERNVGARGPEECRKFTSDIPAYMHGSLRKNRRERLDAHLADCASCSSLLLQVQDVGVLRHALLPLAALVFVPEAVPGTRAGKHAAGKDTTGTAGKRSRAKLGKSGFSPKAKGFAAVMMVLSAALLAAGISNTLTAAGERPSPPVASPSPTPRAEPTEALSAEFTIDSHAGSSLTGTLTIVSPDPLIPGTILALDPGTAGPVDSLKAAPPSGWACSTASSAVQCRPGAAAGTRLVLDLKMIRHACDGATRLSLTVTIPGKSPEHRSWPTPCIGA